MTTAVKTKTFFCEACLDLKKFKEQSKDERYCQWCFDFLTKEAKEYVGKSSWMPRTIPVRQKKRKDKSTSAEIRRLLKKSNGNKKGLQITSENTARQHQVKKMAVTPTNQGKTIEQNNIVAKTVTKNVTEEKIKELSEKGQTTREIGKQLGISHMTVARRLAGQRQLL